LEKSDDERANHNSSSCGLIIYRFTVSAFIDMANHCLYGGGGAGAPGNGGLLGGTPLFVGSAGAEAALGG
jgi:hypothetical protein